jgi:hypothetical protein
VYNVREAGSRAAAVRSPGHSEAMGRLFAAMWAVAHVLHAWHQGGGWQDGHEGMLLALVLVGGLYVLARPSEPRRLAVLAGVQTVTYVSAMPLVANHWTIAVFVNLGLLAAYARAKRAGTAGSWDFLWSFAPCGRTIFLVAYSAAALAKLNTAFLDPVGSCAIATLEPVASWVGISMPPAGGALSHVVVWLVVGVELSVPLLLLLPRTRRVGMGLCGTFHVLLAMTPVVLVMDFTAYVLALLLLFAPADFADRLAGEAVATARRWPGFAGLRRRLGALAGYVAAACVLVLGVAREDVGAELWMSVTWAVFLMYGVGALAVGLAILASYRIVPAVDLVPGERVKLPATQLLLVGLIVLNAASPYVGGKTTSSFTMFSNLATEGGVSNHLFLPRLGVRTSQDDLALVLSSSEPFLQSVADEGQLLAFHELRRRLSADPDASIEYLRGGVQVSRDRAGDDPDLVGLSWLPRKVLHFRAVPLDGSPTCQA